MSDYGSLGKLTASHTRMEYCTAKACTRYAVYGNTLQGRIVNVCTVCHVLSFVAVAGALVPWFGVPLRIIGHGHVGKGSRNTITRCLDGIQTILM